MKFEKLRPGMVVYDVHKRQMGNIKISTVGVWSVRIISVDAENQRVTAVWNGNPAKTFPRHEAEKWRGKEPLTIRMAMGNYRLATREELKAARAGAVDVPF
jgi:hypothetical protein